ncbi:MAG: glucuronyl hydrolase [Chloroflexi bacterium]|nr:glucuronyl hydrolase [Chloroflexota bacterium]
MERNLQHFGLQFPTVGESTRYVLTENKHWLSGFWTGLLWQVYAVSGQACFKDHALKLLPSFRQRLDQQIHITHDLGFLFTLSARPAWQLLGNADARELAVRGARELAARFRPAGKYIQAWGEIGSEDEGGRTIIDTMMNVHLLFWATAQTGEPHFASLARQHSDVTARYLMREDGSSYHTFFFDQHTGEPLGPQTHQGYADDSLWARGQAWAIYGFAAADAWCDAAVYRDVAYRAALRFMAELPADGVPTWDLRLPDDAPSYPDTSAGAIAAAGMFRLANRLTGEHQTTIRSHAETLLRTLIHTSFETLHDAQGLLRGGTYHAHKQQGVDAYFICGDYFFFEALLMHLGQYVDFWGPESVKLRSDPATSV